MTFPDGRKVKFPVNGTAVHALNGRGVMEFAWYDVDPSLPDAATTIVRVYNRGMRRWECLFVTNRFNGILYFGGRQEGDRIVLHTFASNAVDPISWFVFHDIGEAGYGWYGETSTDRGATFNRNWIIRGTRKPRPEASPEAEAP